jgi:hypothetical protein
LSSGDGFRHEEEALPLRIRETAGIRWMEDLGSRSVFRNL